MGINSAKASNGEGMGFAIPIEVALSYANKLENGWDKNLNIEPNSASMHSILVQVDFEVKCKILLSFSYYSSASFNTCGSIIDS